MQRIIFLSTHRKPYIHTLDFHILSKGVTSKSISSLSFGFDGCGVSSENWKNEGWWQQVIIKDVSCLKACGITIYHQSNKEKITLNSEMSGRISVAAKVCYCCWCCYDDKHVTSHWFYMKEWVCMSTYGQRNCLINHLIPTTDLADHTWLFWSILLQTFTNIQILSTLPTCDRESNKRRRRYCTVHAIAEVLIIPARYNWPIKVNWQNLCWHHSTWLLWVCRVFSNAVSHHWLQTG